MSNGCRRCLTQHHDLIATEAEVRRLARILAKTTRPTNLERYKAELAIAKTKRTDARAFVEQGHECDTKLRDEHPSRSGT